VVPGVAGSSPVLRPILRSRFTELRMAQPPNLKSEEGRSYILNNSMKNELQRARGVRDLLPEEKIARNQLVEKLREIFELFGYNPIETPVIERYDLFASKFGIGEASDAMKETFKFSDQGKRDLVLRTEFTMPLARYIGMNSVSMPFKRYQIGKVFRDGPIKLGRYREFWQCDVDCIGIGNMSIDSELIELTQSVFEGFGLDVEIQINNRKILDIILDVSGIKEELRESLIITIDKLDKIGVAGVETELESKGIEKESINKVIKLISIEGSNDQIIAKLEESVGNCEGLDEIKQILDNLGSKGNVRFLPTLARGLAYYSGTVFEVFLKNTKEFGSSLAGGGRYDNMLAGLIGKSNDYPAIGISFGLDAIFDVMSAKKMINEQKTVVEAYVIAISEDEKPFAIKVASQLRELGVRTEVDYLGKKMKKNLEIVNKLNIPFAIIIGEDEAKSEKVAIKNMKTGEQTVCDVNKAKQIIKS
jgi:histidyl-tRNA synthetase